MIEIRIFEAFAGYGSQLMALRRLEKEYPDQIKVTPIGISEIEKNAVKAYKAVHGEVPNYGDISKIDWSQVPDFDLFTYSSPCQDFSNAGLQRGGEAGSGTRSSLLWECERAIAAKKTQISPYGERRRIGSGKVHTAIQQVAEQAGIIRIQEFRNGFECEELQRASKQRAHLYGQHS